MNRHPSRRTALAALTFLGLPAARADDATPLRIVVPTPPGGTNDGVARALQPALQALLGRTVIVDYKPGAAGSVGSAQVARGKPDGSTLLLNNNAVLINPLIARDTGYAMADLAPLVVAATAPLVLICNADLPATDVRGLVAHARQQSRPLAYASAGGVGSLGHLAMERFAREAGIQLLHVPYTGGGPAQLAVSSGEVACVMTTLNAALKGQVEAGRIRLLGVAAARPTPLVPGVPPIGDTLPGFALDAWFGLLAPAKTDPAVLGRIESALLAALATAPVRAQLTTIGVQPVAIGAVAFQARVTEESRSWAEVIRERKIAKD
ncbi:Bug family tripartite tricarboxylate transporter substrate binding protein [Piscinibacter sakaiensis]|uniref:Putative exported protein n=2 Tax=Piscinibacter sakaiensis TaxID=1547922 RepID=A0A0K8P691_PISS1|nr:tripartite tricarboxylate transporter substrate binding protein [Piscinibacter sakaiensis]GAP38116.1 putative exported protein [Piscinibacter sakaiensis]